MPTSQLRPDGVHQNDWPLVGGPNAAAVLSDNNDSSYMRGLFALQLCRLAYNSFVLPAGAVVRTITPILRAGVDDPASSAYCTYQLTINNVNTVGTPYTSPNATSQLGAAPPHIWYLTGIAGPRSQAEIDGLGVSIGSGIITGNTHLLVTEVYCDVLWAAAPTVAATGPTGTLRINNPTVTWAHQPGADAVSGQDYYRVRVYDTANPTVLVFDTGNVAGAAASAVVGPLAMPATYRAVVNTMQTTLGVQQWSPDSSVTFTLDVSGPTVDVTAPTGVIGTTSPTVTWTHTPGSGAQTGQTFYRVRAFKSTDLVTPVIDTGPVASSAASAVIGPLDPASGWRLTVNTAQTTYGVLQWSADDWTDITLDVVTADIASVVPAPDDERGSIPLVITRDTTTPAWLTIDVEGTYDGGATWTPVRGATRLSVNGDTANVTDWEAPNDTPVQYRARASRVSAAVTITGAWVLSPVTSWHLAGDDVWIKDPDHPDRNVKVCLSALPEAVYNRTVGVFRPIGAHYPVVVSDVLQAPTLTASALTNTAAEAAALLTVLAAPVVLVQSPPVAWGWGSRYVAPGAITETRTTPTSRKAVRIFSLVMSEVARPADETAT